MQQVSQSLSFKAGVQAANRRKEFASLDDDSNIYKLVGPVLLKQEKSEAVMAVDGRLEFIEKEMFVPLFPLTDLFWGLLTWDRKRIEGQIQEINNKSDKKRTEVSFASYTMLLSWDNIADVLYEDHPVAVTDSAATGCCWCYCCLSGGLEDRWHFP